MGPLGGIGELYLVSAGIGFVYLLASFLMGQIHGSGTTHAGHADVPTHGLAVAPHGHTGGNLADMGSPHAGAIPHAVTPGHTPAIPGPAHAHMDTTGLTADGGSPTGSSLVYVFPRFASRAARTLFALLNPMTIAIFLAFFGLTGLMLLTVVPSWGAWSVLPALLSALLITKLIANLLGWMFVKMSVTNVIKVEELIGQVARVSVASKGNTIGQITYVVNGMRGTALAKPNKPDLELKRGDRVFIADIRHKVMYVEPWTDSFLPDADGELFVENEP